MVPWNSGGPVAGLVVEWSEAAGGPGGWETTGRGMAADAPAGETGPAEFGILGPLEVSRSGCVLPLAGGACAAAAAGEPGRLNGPAGRGCLEW
jgi:hypothetical protein